MGLSRRQAELVERFAVGHTTKQVSEDMSISETTVRTHLRRIFVTLKIGSRTELVAMVLAHVLADAGTPEYSN
jgi:DNA-binding CsgD family transcriptional regulator